ncbi:AraJ, Arabinose efflux permease [Pyrenophora tritici-repentis]|nr:AraJ, Arabinose efflux permease [Pyrenophora tritici-repentis]
MMNMKFGRLTGGIAGSEQARREARAEDNKSRNSDNMVMGWIHQNGYGKSDGKNADGRQATSPLRARHIDQNEAGYRIPDEYAPHGAI